jgi:VWFA-related protein
LLTNQLIGMRRFWEWGAGGTFLASAALLVSAIAYGQQPPASPQPSQSQKPPGTPAQGQAPAAPPIAVTTKVVNVVASVRDKKGMLVSNLAQTDFVIDEDGRTQTVTYFARDMDLPLTIGLLVDTSMSQRRVLPEERDASQVFLEDVLRPDQDKAFLIHFDEQVEMLQDVTNSRDKLQKALNEMDAPQFAQPNRNQGSQGGPQGGSQGQGGGYPGGPGGYPGGRRGGGYQRAGTTLYDAVYLASDEVVKKQMGRKTLILLTDGVDRGSKESLNAAIETAQRADTIVYAIYFADQEQMQSPFGRGGPFGGPDGGGRRGGGGGSGGRFPQEERVDGKKVLEQMTKETGGRLFEVSKKETIGQIYASISDELRKQYSLGYTPEPDPGYGYHTIHVTTKQTDLAVQARDGYFE